MLGNVSCFCCRQLTFFKINLKKNLSGTLSENQKVWIQIRTNILIWVQTVCKGYQQMTTVAASKARVNKSMQFSIDPSIYQLFFLNQESNHQGWTNGWTDPGMDDQHANKVCRSTKNINLLPHFRIPVIT